MKMLGTWGMDSMWSRYMHTCEWDGHIIWWKTKNEGLAYSRCDHGALFSNVTMPTRMFTERFSVYQSCNMMSTWQERIWHDGIYRNDGESGIARWKQRTGDGTWILKFFENSVGHPLRSLCCVCTRHFHGATVDVVSRWLAQRMLHAMLAICRMIFRTMVVQSHHGSVILDLPIFHFLPKTNPLADLTVVKL